MPDAFSPDTPELRLLAQLAGVRPDRLSDALKDPNHIARHMTVDEGQRLVDAFTRLLPIVERFNEAIELAKGKH